MGKEEIARLITDKIGVSPVIFSRGSTEPKTLFIQTANAIGLKFAEDIAKTELAKIIVESAGIIWLEHFESSGGTVTKEGLLAVKDSVDFFLD